MEIVIADEEIIYLIKLIKQKFNINYFYLINFV